MTKTLEIGQDYAGAFPLPEGAKMIYNGGISWTGIMGDRTMTLESQKQTDGALEYINRPSRMSGMY